MKRVEYTKAATKVMDRMQPKRRDAIRLKVDAFARGERVDVKKLKGSPLLRIRVGDDRVILDEQTMLVIVVEVGPRGGIYKE
ncbi:type II toxin-antitoxin system RelE family toxin [Allorhizobium taibaishanense]|uniref:Cytotoxic translational repressor of toxin-antitoxin stability system n=1 Tax=Allorhizobium taibaishanense TaxID=887144 RepID=A0A1Q9AAQ9_9HYPH|nr:cytotoxic translational repressor of toxin-antitoxin stability system [Allorhizobium taibaishanense]MBB4007131.1 mRNA interferase RelE/StbE [Allorhizobium taibaishanense]OLP51918.1 cytotoxic translational repressor of toxin-antitoxin stability system [Allorhizobium taibaishanense]